MDEILRLNQLTHRAHLEINQRFVEDSPSTLRDSIEQLNQFAINWHSAEPTPSNRSLREKVKGLVLGLSRLLEVTIELSHYLRTQSHDDPRGNRFDICTIHSIPQSPFESEELDSMEKRLSSRLIDLNTFYKRRCAALTRSSFTDTIEFDRELDQQLFAMVNESLSIGHRLSALSQRTICLPHDPIGVVRHT